MEVLSVRSIKHVYTVKRVGGGVRVYNIHQYYYTVAVRCVDKILEFIGGATA